MRFLADMGVATSTVRALVAAGHDAVRLSPLGLQRLADDQILVKARDEKRIVITFDLDFADLPALGLFDSPSVVIFRLHDQTPASVTHKPESGHRGAGSRTRTRRVDHHRGCALPYATSSY
jgi:predicted nuclease of predicted toxin-antitoxin system